MLCRAGVCAAALDGNPREGPARQMSSDNKPLVLPQRPPASLLSSGNTFMLSGAAHRGAWAPTEPAPPPQPRVIIELAAIGSDRDPSPPSPCVKVLSGCYITIPPLFECTWRSSPITATGFAPRESVDSELVGGWFGEGPGTGWAAEVHPSQWQLSSYAPLPLNRPYGAQGSCMSRVLLASVCLGLCPWPVSGCVCLCVC